MRGVTIALSALLLIGAAQARAASVEPRVRLIVRAAPSSGARIVDRVAAGRKLPLLGRSADGAWARVQAPRGQGWVPASQLKGRVARAQAEADDEPADDEPPLAQKRNVRAEAWVSQSRYHDGEDNKMTVSANKAELYGRPAAGGAVLGIVRRGEVVRLVRKSADKRWCLVDVGGGETAWLDARTVRAGAFRAPVSADDAVAAEPPPVSERARRMPAERVTPVEVAERDREREREAAPEPPPAPRKGRRVAEVAPPAEPEEPLPPPTRKGRRGVEEAPPVDEPPPPARTARGDDEVAPGMASSAPVAPTSKKRGKKGMRLASRGGTDASPAFASASADRSASELTVERGISRESTSANTLSATAQAGVAILGQRFTSNGSGALTNYQADTDAFGLMIGLGYQRAVGKYLRLGLDGEYAFAGGGAVRYRTDAGNLILGVQTHTIDFGASAGVHFDVIGGLELGVRLGGEIGLNLIAPNLKAPLPSDRVVGMTIGAGASAPSLFRIAQRPVGLRIAGGGLVPADRAQTPGLEDGTSSTTYGAFFGGAVTFGLTAPPTPGKKYVGNLLLAASYNYNIAATHYTGQSHRNVTITAADRGSAQHLISFGLVYVY
jgi:uncharacterized protein YgiM (DUF1202 family)